MAGPSVTEIGAEATLFGLPRRCCVSLKSDDKQGDRLGCDDNEPAGPAWPRFPKCDPEASVGVVEAGPGSLAIQGHQLLAQRQVLQEEIRPRSEESPNDLDNERDSRGEESREGEHGCEILADEISDLKLV